MTAQPSRSGNAESTTPTATGTAKNSRVTAVLDRFWPQTGQRWTPFGERPRSWWPDILLALAVVAVTSLLVWRSPLVMLDIGLRDWALETRPEWAFIVADIARYVGQGTPLTIIVLGLAIVSARRYHTVRPIVLHVAAWLSVNIVIGLFKEWADRVAPRFPDTNGPPPYVEADGSLLFSGLDHMSFPSGHAANTAVWYGLIVMLIGVNMTSQWRRILLVAPPIILILAQTYTTFHWISDVIVGLLVGFLIVRQLQRIPWESIRLGPLARFDTGP